jgi:L-threonylcarbamoyladenylate synthase
MKVFSPHEIPAICDFLRTGHILATPTETVFGLCVQYDNFPAIQKLMRLKERGVDSGKIFALMIHDKNLISRFALIPLLARPIIKNHLPDELTLVLPKNPAFKNPYFDHFPTIGIRVPRDPFLQTLLSASGALIMTSANLKGENPALTPEAAAKLPIDGVVNASAGGSAPTTVLSVTDRQIQILRQGGLKIS